MKDMKLAHQYYMSAMYTIWIIQNILYIYNSHFNITKECKNTIIQQHTLFTKSIIKLIQM